MHQGGMADVAKQRHRHFLAWMEANGLNANKVAARSGVPYNTLNSYEKTGAKATQSLKGSTEAMIARAYDVPIEAIFGVAGDEGREVEPNNLRAWREYRGLSVAETARLVGTSPAVIELLEAGGASLSLKWLYKFKAAFGVNVGTIADFKPSDLPSDYLKSFPAPNASGSPEPPPQATPEKKRRRA